MVEHPHKYRCETCKTPDCPVWLPDNAKLAQRGKVCGDHHILTILSKCGCASHSNAIKAEQQIADVIAILQERHDDGIRLVMAQDVIALLRGKEE